MTQQHFGITKKELRHPKLCRRKKIVFCHLAGNLIPLILLIIKIGKNCSGAILVTVCSGAKGKILFFHKIDQASEKFVALHGLEEATAPSEIILQKMTEVTWCKQDSLDTIIAGNNFEDA